MPETKSKLISSNTLLAVYAFMFGGSGIRTSVWTNPSK